MTHSVQSMRSFLKFIIPLLMFASANAHQPRLIDPADMKAKGGSNSIFLPTRSDSSHSYDAISYRLNIRIFPEQSKLAGINHITGIIGENPLMTIPFHCCDLEIDSVKSGPETFGFSVNDSILSVFLGHAYFPADTFKFDVYYTGVRGDDSQRGFYFNDSCAYTMSEPYDARYWIPCFDEPFDKVTFEASVSVPVGYLAVSNGIPAGISEHPEDSTIIFRWIENHPIATYLMAITIGRYLKWKVEVPDTHGGLIPVYYYVYPEDSANADYDFGNVPSMLTYFINHFFDYPFDKYGMVTASQFRYGGMEHQSISTIHRNWIGGDRHLENGIVHELAHQWWGDYVTLADFRHIWLNEGFATYSGILWLGSFYGEDRFRQELTSIMNAFFYENDSVLSYPIYNPPYVFGAACYWKGAFVLRMLQSYLGDEAFFRAMRAYANRYAFGNASTDDFRNLLEQETGISLDRFFEQWVYTAGYPQFGFNWDVEPNIGGFTLDIDITQLQDEIIYETFLDFAAHKDNFEFPFRVFMTEQNQSFSLQIPIDPDSIVFNPEFTLLAKAADMTDVADESIPPQAAALMQNYPNPFNICTIIPYHLNGDGVLKIFDLSGRLVRSFNLSNRGNLVWDGLNSVGEAVSSGIYFYQLHSQDLSINRKMLVLR